MSEIRYICRGPLLRSDEDQRPLFDRWYEIEDRAVLEEAVRFVLGQFIGVQAIADQANPGYRLPEPKDQIARAVKRPQPWIELRRIVFPLIRPRREIIGLPCGRDVSDVIQGIPEDGEVHEFACPDCGADGTVRRVPALV